MFHMEQFKEGKQGHCGIVRLFGTFWLVWTLWIDPNILLVWGVGRQRRCAFGVKRRSGFYNIFYHFTGNFYQYWKFQYLPCQIFPGYFHQIWEFKPYITIKYHKHMFMVKIKKRLAEHLFRPKIGSFYKKCNILQKRNATTQQHQGFPLLHFLLHFLKSL